MTKKAFTLSVFILIQFLHPITAFAQKTLADCEKAEHATAQQSRCLDAVKDVLDRELQTWVNHHVFNLEEKALVTGRYSALKMFKRSQSNFITFRDNDCRWQYLAISPEKGAGIAYKKCYVSVTQSRINELESVK
ncbi:MAG: DUF1311 domain-containing protein [Colwellia sp.]|nr:DUF1311 domain-containing protein [Colwellia sp.]